MNYSDKKIQKLLEDIYEGRITEYDLPDDLYFAIADYLKRGVYEGFGMTLADAAGKDLELLEELRINTYQFSAAKTFQQVKEISSLLVDENGDLRTMRQFTKVAREAFSLWNDVYGEAEYATAIGQANQAVKWNEIQKNKSFLPMLRYSAVLDKNTSDICRPLDGIIAPVGDKIWNKIAPLNHFRCRCVLEQLDDSYAATDGNDKVVNDVLGEMDDTFKMNPGKDGYIFSEKHPYFSVVPKDKAYAERNFDLPIPPKDKK